MSDDELHAVAVQILGTARVRSVTVDSERVTALVRLKTNTPTRAAGQAAVEEARTSLLASSFVDDAIAKTRAVELVSWVDSRDGSISFIRMPERVRGWRRALYVVLAVVALSLGLLGIVLPGLPTTPFVLLGSYFLIRSSTRLHERLMASRVFGGVLRDWHLHRGLRPHVRVRAVAVVAIVVAVSLLVARPAWPVVAAIVLLAACGLSVIWRLPSVRDDEGR